MSKQDRRLYEFGLFRLDPIERQLTRSGTPIPLTPKAFDTLCALVENGGQIMDKDALLQRVWPDTFVEEATLAQNISTLRKALGVSMEGEIYIQTVPKRGYRFVAPVQVSTFPLLDPNQDVSTAAAVSHAQKLTVQAVVAGPVRLKEPISISFRLGIAMLILCLIFVLAWLAWNFKAERRVPIREAGHPIQSIVVLPFANLSGDVSQEYLADGMTEALITDLARVGSFRVISRISSMHYKGSQKRLPEIARELGNVDAVVEGSVFRSGNRVSLTVQIVFASSDQTIWAERYERGFEEIVTLQANLASAVIRQIAIQPVSQQRKIRMMNPNAEDAYLRGRYELGQDTLEGNRLAIEYFQRAVQIESDSPAAYAGLAESYNQAHLFGAQPLKSFLLAKAAAARALELDNSIAEAHSLMGSTKVYLERDWQGAQLEFKNAIELSPGSSSVHLQYAQSYLMPLGRTQEALAEFRKALESDPLSLLVNNNLGWHFVFARQYDNAIEQFNKTLNLDPDFTLAHWGLMVAYEQKSLYKEAARAFQRTEESIDANPEFIKSIEKAYNTAGVSGYWRKRLEASLLHQRQGLHMGVELAIGYAQLGQKDHAFQLLLKADLERAPRLIQLNVDPELDLLRSDPRFDELRKRLHLPVT